MAGASSDRNMKLYLEANLAKFARKDSSLGYRLTRYVDGLDSRMFDRLKDWQNVKTHLQLDHQTLEAECARLIQEVHSSTEKMWDAYHCVISIHKQHAVVIFIPIESKDTPYNQTGWCTFSCPYPVDVFRVHLAFSEDSDEEYAVYLQKVTKHYEDIKLFLYCNVLTSYEALQSLIYTTALLLGNYRELESDCLEFAKAVAKQAKRFFATEVEMGKAIVNLRMDEFNPQALDNLTVTSLKSEAVSRTKATSRYPAVSLFLLATQCNQILLMILVSFISAFFAVLFYDYFFRN